MSSLLYFTIYLGVVLLLAAQLFYPVFQAVDAYWDLRPDRVFHRLVLLIAVLGFWPFLRLLGMNNRYALGYALAPGRFVRTVFTGLAVGTGIMALHIAVLLVLGVRTFSPEAVPFGDWMYLLASGLLGGVLVALIEESFFRGAMQYHLRYSHSLSATLVFTSLFYAAVHFIHPPEPAAGAPVDWRSGWNMLEGMLDQFKNFAGLVDSFAALFMAGLLLALVRERSGNIALCIGIHAGWIMMIRLTRGVSVESSDSSNAFLTGSYDGVIGWAAAIVLGLVALAYWLTGSGRKG